MSKNLVTALPSFSAGALVHSEDGPRKMNRDNHPRPRFGKTRKDKESRAKERNTSNKQSRALWQQDPKATRENFPYISCNGKRNRTRIDRTRKGDLRLNYK